MEKLISICAIWLEQKEYKKILMGILILFSLIGPSMSIIFLYQRNLFFELDIFRLITICLILNTIIFVILFIIFNIYMELETKLNEIKILLKLNEIKPEIKEYIDNENYKEIDLKLRNLEKKYNKNLKDDNSSIIATNIYIILYTSFIWADYILFENIYDNYLIISVLLFMVVPIISIFFILFRVFSLYVKNFLIQKMNTNFIVKFILYRLVEFFIYIVPSFFILYTVSKVIMARYNL